MPLYGVDSGIPDQLWLIDRPRQIAALSGTGLFPVGYRSPSGLAWDGINLYCVDDSGDGLLAD